MLDLAFKNIFRQKTRTALTIIGIMIGIGAIVGLGSISEGLRTTITEQLQQVSGMIMVYEESNAQIFIAMSTSRLSESTVNEIMSMGGIEDAVAVIMDVSYLEGSTTFGPPTFMKIGVDPEKVALYTTENVKIKEGTNLEEGDEYYCTVGEILAEELGVDVGDTIDIDGSSLEVKGIYEEYGDEGIDSAVIIPVDVAKDVLNRDDYSMVILYAEDVEESEELAQTIEDTVEDVTAFSTEEFGEQISDIIDQISIYTIGIAAVSAVVGGLGVMNTMIMSVMERRREIGVMKAVGATKKYVIKMILIESSLLSLLGGILGIGIGFLVSLAIGNVAGSVRALVTPKLILNSLIFAVVLGVLGGLYPSKRAADLSPVEALRYE